MLPALIGAGVGLIGGIGGLFAAKKANKELSKLQKQDPTYTANPLAAERLAFAESLLNGRMPGAAQMERNIFSAQGSQMGNINANATDASQALALGAAAQGTTNNALQGLQLNEAQDYQRRYQNVVGAQQGQIQEGDKVYADKIRNFEDQVAMAGAKSANRSNAWNSISKGGFSAMNFGLAGGWDALVPKGNGQQGNGFSGISSANNYGADPNNDQFFKP
jgi:hypothetical protein